jgi:hypothetical protein
MLLLFARIVAFSLSLVLWPWNLLFGRVYESLEAWKVFFFNFIYGSGSFLLYVYIISLAMEQTVDKWWFKHAYIPTNIALVKIKQKS